MDSPEISAFSDADFAVAVFRSLKLLLALTVVAAAVTFWKAGWQSAALLCVGAGITGSGLWEWQRLMSAVMARMEAGATPRPMGAIVTKFFLRLGLTVVVLYVSLRYLHGSVYALAAGLGLGVLALMVEGIRLLKTWTV